MRRAHVPRISWLVALGLSLPAIGRPESAWVRVPGATIALGSTVDDLIAAATHCNRLTGQATCEPEDFALERRDKTAVVPSFLLERTEVSVGQYARCVRAGVCSPHAMPGALLGTGEPDLLPVTMVSLDQARAYCAFKGARLPSEDEFELAARGPHGRRYPWGNLFHAGRVNGGSPAPTYTNARDGYELLAPVEALPAGRTPLGILQLSGNVAEWTSSIEADAAGMPTGRVLIRGGHFASPPWQLRAAQRESLSASERRPTLGFRCARSLAAEPDEA